MAQKWNLQDIRPAAPKKSRKTASSRSTAAQDVTVRKTRSYEEKPAPPPPIPEQETSSYSRPPSYSHAGTGKKRKLFIALGFVGVLALTTFIGMLFGGAELTVYPKFKETSVQGTFTAETTASSEDLPFEVLTLEADGERQVTATGQEEAEERATGTITIFNAFSQNTQRLIKNTRFESPEGLVFRIEESAEVPGFTKESDGTVVPGSITATVFADDTGEEYNVAPTRFTIPGLDGTDQFEDMYAESNSAFSGGFKGTRYIIDETELKNAQDALHEELKAALRTRLDSEKPAGFVLYDSALTYTFESLPAVESGNDLATIRERVTLHAPLFGETAFAQHIARNTIAGFEDDAVKISDAETLAFEYVSEPNLASDESIRFQLTGKAQIVWDFDEEQLAIDLAGMSKTALQTVLGGYSAIERAEARIKPFWKQSFPDEPEEITIIRVVGTE